MKTINLIKTILVIILLSLSITSCETFGLNDPEPESKFKDFIGKMIIHNKYGVLNNRAYFILEYSVGSIDIKNSAIIPFTSTLGKRYITKDSIGTANNWDDITYGNKMIILDNGKYIIRYKNDSDITIIN